MSFDVSVVIPCKNAERWIDAALASVAAQRLAPIETLVVDDGSTDRSLEVVRRWGGATVLTSTGPGNAARARNVGIQAARGEWVAFLDADDVWYPDHLARAAARLGAADAGYMANHDWLDQGGWPVPMPIGFHHDLASGAGLAPEVFVDALSRGFHFGHSTVVVRRSRTLAVGGFDESQVRRHDLDHWLRVLRGRTWAYDREPSAGYRLGTGGISMDVLACELYYLRALVRNREGFPTAAMDRLLATSAQRAMSLSFVNGTPEQQREARALGWSFLHPGYRAFYRLSDLWAGPLRQAIRVKRSVRALFRPGEWRP